MKSASRIKDLDFYAELGSTIRTLRELSGKTQEDVAAHLDLSFQQVQKYEAGRNRMPIDRLVSLSQYLGVPVERFFSFAPGPTSVSTDVGRLLSSLKRQDMSFLSLWSGLRDRRARSAVLAVLQWLSDRPASARAATASKRPPDSRFWARES